MITWQLPFPRESGKPVKREAERFAGACGSEIAKTKCSRLSSLASKGEQHDRETPQCGAEDGSR